MLTAASNHSPLFYVDESAIPIASRAFGQLALDYLTTGAAGEPAITPAK
jgi:hypothetical protein